MTQQTVETQALQSLKNSIFEAEENKTKAAMIFLVKAKSVDPNCTLNDCHEILGVDTSDTNADQNFRNSVYNPVRNYITAKMFNLDKAAVDAFWSRGKKSDEEKERQAQVLAKLPERKRKTRAVVNRLSFLDDLL